MSSRENTIKSMAHFNTYFEVIFMRDTSANLNSRYLPFKGVYRRSK